LEGKHILEIGGGSGDCTAELATAVGASGSVVSVDPYNPDLTSSWTWRQQRMQGSKWAPERQRRIRFVHADPIDFLNTNTTSYDDAIINLCNWHFTSRDILDTTFQALSHRVDRVFISELVVPKHPDTLSNKATYDAHRAQCLLAKHEPWLPWSIFTMFRREEIIASAAQSGFTLVRESTIKGNAEHTRADFGTWRYIDLERRLDKLLTKNGQDMWKRTEVEDAIKLLRHLVADDLEPRDIWCAMFELTGCASDALV